jgi:hypothetical protein
MDRRHRVRVRRELRDLIPAYIENRRREVSTLTDALSRKDYAFIQCVGHQVECHGGAFGFHGMSRLGSEIEQASKYRDRLLIRSSVRKFANYLKELEVVYSD